MTQRYLALVGLLVLAPACSLQKMTVDETAQILAQANRAMTSETDLDLAAAAIPGSLKTVEGFLEADPQQPILLRLLAEGYMSYSFGFLEGHAEQLEDDHPNQAEHLRQRAIALDLRARNFGLRLLALDRPELAATLTQGHMPTAPQLATIDEDTLPGLFWTADPWATAINVGKSDPQLLAQLGIVKALMRRCAAIDPGYYHAGPELALGAMAASLPKALGGKPAEARKHFEAAVKLTGGTYLMIRTMYGRLVGVQAGDKAFFKKELEGVLHADPDADPNAALANRLAQRRARRYLNHIDDFFL